MRFRSDKKTGHEYAYIEICCCGGVFFFISGGLACVRADFVVQLSGYLVKYKQFIFDGFETEAILELNPLSSNIFVAHEIRCFLSLYEICNENEKYNQVYISIMTRTSLISRFSKWNKET